MEDLMKNNTYTLSNQLQIPAIGLGTNLLDGNQAYVLVKEAIQNGCPLVDTASFYENEEEIGKALQETDRTKCFLVSKLWKDQMGYSKARKAFDESLSRLHTDYIDLYLIHWPSDDESLNKETWQALIDLYKEGKVRAIGVSNFNVEQLLQLMDMEIVPMVNEIEYHPQNKQNNIVSFCKAHNIQVIASSPLGRGKILDNFLVKRLAKKYQKTPAQIVLRCIFQNKIIPIPKSSNSLRIKENLNIFDFELEDKDLENLNSLPPLASGE